MKIEAQNLIDYHCPRWNELPEIELYIDQVICVLQNNLAIFLKEENTPVITPNMINNYVKQEVLMPPIKKKYSKTHLAYLFVICILKRLMSISEINESIKSMKKSYSVEDGYNVFNPTEEIEPIFKEEDTREYATLKAIVSAFANCILVDKLILLRK